MKGANLLHKQGFGDSDTKTTVVPCFCGLYSKAAYNLERPLLARVRYTLLEDPCSTNSITMNDFRAEK